MLSKSLRRLAWVALPLLGLAAPAPAQDPGAVPATLKPVPREGAWMKMHESFLERTKQGEVGLLFLGDSITQAWSGPGKETWNRFYAPRKAANFGIGGDRTEHILWRLDNGEVDGISPKVVVLMIGTNNSGDNSADEIAAGVKAIVAKLHDKLPKAKILLLGVFPRADRPEPIPSKLKAVNEQIAKLDDGGKTVKFLDIGGKFLEADGTLTKQMMPDLLHLSPKAYRIWADAIEPTLFPMLEAG